MKEKGYEQGMILLRREFHQAKVGLRLMSGG